MKLNINNDCLYIGNKKSASINIIWFHGYGSNNWSFEPALKILNDSLAEKLFIIVPNAEYVEGKRSWYPLPTVAEDNSISEDYDGLITSKGLVYDFIAENDLDIKKPLIIGGFSQGAALSLSLIFDKKIKIDGCLAISGYFPCADHLTNKLSDKEQIYISHGRKDQAIGFDVYERTLELIKSKCSKVYNIEGEHGHAMPKDSLETISKFIQSNYL